MSKLARQSSCHLTLSLSGGRDVTHLHGPEDSVDLSGHVSLQAADDLALGLAFCRASSHVVLRRLVPAQTDHDDVIEGTVGLAVAAPVEPVARDLARRGLDG